MARTSGLLYIAGAVLALTALLLTDERPSARESMFGLAAFALVVGGLIVACGRHFPRWTYQVLISLGTVLISVMVYLAGGGADSWGYGSLYVFVAVDFFFFFSWPVALAHLAALEICAAVAFFAVDLPFSAFAVQQGCVAVVAILVGSLARAASAAELDPLTGLSNLRGFKRAIDDAIAVTDRATGRLALVTIDFDDFKSVNEVEGVAHGDRIIRLAARTWAPMLADGQVMARPGGDDFAFILPDCSAEQAVVLADQLRQAVAAHIACSAGVAELLPGDSASMLVNRSDVALYQAKSAGRARTAQYGVESDDCTEVHAGLIAGEFRVFYQPIIDFGTGRACGAEALVRWQHPTRGLVAPDRFIPDAERTGSIRAIGAWVLREACTHAASEFTRSGVVSSIAVNVSGRELRNPDYPRFVAEVLVQTGLDPQALTIEITESTLDADQPQVVATVRELRKQGITIAIDDFGTGYSNLIRLSRVQVDILKIDKSFVEDIPAAGGDVPILSAIVALAQALHLETVAEGVETEVQARVLKQIGCTYAQGYLFGRPQPAIHDEQPGRTRALSPSGVPAPDLGR